MRLHKFGKVKGQIRKTTVVSYTEIFACPDSTHTTIAGEYSSLGTRLTQQQKKNGGRARAGEFEN